MPASKFTSLKALKAQGEKLQKDLEGYKKNVEALLEKQKNEALKGKKSEAPPGTETIYDFILSYTPSREDILQGLGAEIRSDGELWTEDAIQATITHLVREGRIMLVGGKYHHV